MELSDKQKQKQEAIDCLRRRLTDDVRQRLREVDERLLGYIDGVARDVSVIFGDESDRHSMWEVLCAAKFIRMFTTYHFNVKKVQFYIALREGQWERRGKAWRYISGGLRLLLTAELICHSGQKARELGHSYVGSVHLLLAMLTSRGTAGELLRGTGMDPGLTEKMAVVLCGTGWLNNSKASSRICCASCSASSIVRWSSSHQIL